MKAGKLAIQPWLSCRYAKNTFMDESCYKVKYSRSLFIQRNEVVKTDKKKRQRLCDYRGGLAVYIVAFIAYLDTFLKALAKGDQQNVRRSEEKKTKNEYFRNTNCNRPCL